MHKISIFNDSSNYKFYDYQLFLVKEQSDIVTFIHWDHDFDKDILDWVDSLCVKVNNLYRKYYRLYSFCHYPNLFTNRFPNFDYVYKPELIFLNSQKFINFDEIPNLRQVKLEKTFCLLNNRPTPWRKNLFCFFRDNNLLDMSYASYNNSANRHRSKDNFIEEPYKNFIENKVYEDANLSIGYYYPVHNFLFDVCAETYIEDYIGLTEKSIKPFLWGYIPLIYGPAGTYRYLKDLGLDVFDNIIDTSFDNERNHNTRMWRFQQEVLRLSKIPLNNYDIMQLESRFHNNRNAFLKNAKHCLQTLDWIEQETRFLIHNKEQYLGF